MTTTIDPLAALCAHLGCPRAARDRLGPRGRCTVCVAGDREFAHHESSAIAQGLLTWADTLTGVTAEAWRIPRRDSVHLSVTGPLPGGASVLVYGGLRSTLRGLGADLPRDATTTIPLPMLWHGTTVEEARA